MQLNTTKPVTYGPLMICHLIKDRHTILLNCSHRAALGNRILAVSPAPLKPSVSLPALQVFASHLSYQVFAARRQRKASWSLEAGDVLVWLLVWFCFSP